MVLHADYLAAVAAKDKRIAELDTALREIIAQQESTPTIGYKRGQWWTARCASIDTARAALEAE